jgi:serine protease Do
VVITAIDPGSTAARANLREGDLVVEIDGQEVASLKAFETAAGKVAKGSVLRLLVQRGETLFYTTLRAE